MRVLFDMGVAHIFIVKDLARQLKMKVHLASFNLKLVSPMETQEIVVDCTLTNSLIIGEHHYAAQLILLEISKFDLILGMDWLGEHDVCIDYQKRKLRIGWDTE